MEKKTKIIVFSTISIFVIILGILTGFYAYKHSTNTSTDTSKTNDIVENANKTDSLSDVEKEIAGIKDNSSEQKEDEEKDYSELYKEYEKLSEEEKEKLEVIPRKYDIPFEKLEEIKEELDNKQKEEELEKDDSIIPEKFNLAEKIDIKVGNQFSYGLCWDFASIKTLETYLALNKLGNYDFSKLHVDYITSNLLYGTRKVHDGGTFGNFQDYVIESDVVLEEDVPYSYNWTGVVDGKEYTYTNLYNYKEEEYNKFPGMQKVVEVTETVDFPSFTKYAYSDYTEEQIAEFRETVKRHIMKNGGLYTSIVSTIAKNHYTAPDTNEFVNHAVTIVGWDDNYSKDNFLSSDGKKTSKDGAYIVLNSWGTRYHNGGYYYISYEDKYVESNLSGVVSTSLDSAYKINSIKNKAIKDFLVDNYSHQFIEKDGELYVTKNVLSNIYSLDLSNKNLTSLDGIEVFTNLHTLNASDNNITDITPLSQLHSLSNINLKNNNITDLSVFENMKTNTVWKLDLENNNIKDVTPLSELNKKSSFYLILSQNPEIETGLDTLSNVYNLDLSYCNIKDISALQNLDKLDELNLTGNPSLTSLDKLPKNLYSLMISNCNLNDLSILKDLEKINYLDISSNNITSLAGIEHLESIYTLDVSNNDITDWSALTTLANNIVTARQTQKPDEAYDEYDEYYDNCYLSIEANNCNIDDITVFNNLGVSLDLSLKDNNITDISQFENDSVYYINLSGNKKITGLEALKSISIVYLDDCEINNIDELVKLEHVSELSLENNNLTDITALSNLKDLYCISLAGNKQLCGVLSSENIMILNIRDCNIDDSFDLSKLKNLDTLNIGNNSNIKDIKSMVTSVPTEYLYLIIDELDFEQFENIMQDENSIHFRYNTL